MLITEELAAPATGHCPECGCANGWHEGGCSIGLAEVDRVAVEKLQAILSDIVQRPLTPDEMARTHSHVAAVNAIFDGSLRDDYDRNHRSPFSQAGQA